VGRREVKLVVERPAALKEVVVKVEEKAEVRKAAAVES
jgi:hypothetical protein